MHDQNMDRSLYVAMLQLLDEDEATPWVTENSSASLTCFG